MQLNPDALCTSFAVKNYAVFQRKNADVISQNIEDITQMKLTTVSYEVFVPFQTIHAFGNNLARILKGSELDATFNML